MQEFLWLLTLALMLLLAVIFVAVIWQAALPTHAPSYSTGNYRQLLFWSLAVIGVVVTYATLSPWPYNPAPRSTDAPLRVNAVSEQWSWSVDRTQLPLNKPVVFSSPAGTSITVLASTIPT